MLRFVRVNNHFSDTLRKYPRRNAPMVRLSYDIESLRGGDEGSGRVGARSSAVLHNGVECWVRKHEVPLMRRKEKAYSRCCMMNAWF